MRQPAQEETIAGIQASLRTLATTGFRIGATQYFAWLVEALRSDGRLVEALAAVEDGLTAAPEEGFYRPELLRLRASLLARTGADTATVDAAYQEAITLADEQGHVVFGLRATVSFSHWLLASDRFDAASAVLNWRREMLTEILETAGARGADAAANN